MSNKDFYRAFEDAHRGSRKLIKERVSVYLPFVLPLKNIYNEGLALDIGCGRGEWLELLKDNGIDAQGVDLDRGMLEACTKLKLDVKYGNGISHLKEQANESLMIISAFHVVEHISFEDLQTLVGEALRVLKPGGLLIMETPNPENIKVATENFYLDPTHIKPIPSTLLSFLPEFYGYKRSKILRLQEPKELINQEKINFSDVLGGVSPDYSVVAQKDASDDILEQFNEVFSQEFGLPFTALTEKFEHRLLSIEEKASQAEEKASQAEEKASQAELRTNDALHHYHMVVNSNSWKLTKPLRLVGKSARWFVTGVKHWITFSPTSRPRRILKKTIVSLRNHINAHPSVKMELLNILNHFPYLKVRLKNLILSDISYKTHEKDELTYQAQKIYTDLKRLCNQIPNTAHKSKNKKMAIVTPLPPAQTGIADYIAELLPSLSNIYDIEIITDTKNSYGMYPTYDIDFFKNNTKRYNRIIYQVGNSPHHWYMFDLIKKIPGIVILHDFYLGNIIHWVQNNKNTYPNIWEDALIESHGYSSVYMRAQKGVTWAIDHYPANIQILQNAKAIIVHSKYAKTLTTNWYGRKFENKFYYLPQVHKEILEPRIVNSKEFLVCSFGHITKQKMILEIIYAWIDTGLNNNTNSRLIFVGACGEDEYGQKIKKLVKSLENVEITGFIQDEEFHNYLLNTNLAIQLRKESKGETSRALLDCMSYGIPTIINKNGSMVEFPDNIVYKISDKFNKDELHTALNKLYTDKVLCNELSMNAKSYIAKKHRPDIVSKLMQNIIEDIYNKRFPLSISELCQNQELNTIPLRTQEISDLAKTYEMNQRNGQTPNIYIDISVIALNDLKTGIQRVVRAILISLFKMPTNTFKIIPVYLTDKNGYWHYRVAHNFMKSLAPDLAPRIDTVIEPSASEIFIGLDFTNAITEITKTGLFDLWKKRGTSINFIVYDILPIQFPNFFPVIAHNEHIKWLKAVSKVSDNILCISKTVQHDVRDHLLKSGIEEQSLPNIDFFHLGADIENSVPSKGLPDDARERLTQFSSSQSFLMTGTIEPRKGHMQTLLAFEEFWKNNIDVNLIFVGKEGWLVKTLIAKIKKHPELNKRLFWLNGISDEYLEKIYQNSTCLIAASEAEGFGLPLIEAAQHKIPIIARDIPVFREVAGEYAYYFKNKKDPQVLSNAIKNWIELHQQNKHPKSDNMPWLTWGESANQLLRCMGITQNNKGEIHT